MSNQSYPCVLTPENRGLYVADCFEAMQHDPLDPFVKASYERFCLDTFQQFKLAYRLIIVEPLEAKGEPYQDAEAMFEDIFVNRHLFFYPTMTAFGEGPPLDNHPLLEPTDFVVGGLTLCVNDLFRVTHDYFGHAPARCGFDSRGEELAWLSHLPLFHPLARPAFTTEILGQASWVNFGPHLRNHKGTMIKPGEPGWIPQTQRPFAEQKAGLLPAVVSGVSLTRDEVSGQIDAEFVDSPILQAIKRERDSAE